jgi:hypothetical protein
VCSVALAGVVVTHAKISKSFFGHTENSDGFSTFLNRISVLTCIRYIVHLHDLNRREQGTFAAKVATKRQTFFEYR